MKCPRCRHENPPQSKFCFDCGTRLTLTCESCGAELPGGVKFCNQCGKPVGQPATEWRFGAPESYTPKHLAEKILTSKAALEGERKQVTILFADMKGSMELLADRDPEEARRILDPVLELMMDAVHRYEGTVNQVMGDGIMALFGAPLAHEDHAVRSCYAALRMQEAVNRHADELLRSQGIRVQLRVGLDSGEVVVRAIGSDLRMDYSAVGQTAHLAARMEQIAGPGSILLTAETLRLAEGFVEVRLRGRVLVKGLVEPVEIYDLVGAGPARRRFEATAMRGLTRFVGRDAELDQLGTALDLAANGYGQVVAVVGDPGVGKSRLFHEFSHSHRTQGWLILESGSVSYWKATPYLPVIDLLKGYFEIETGDDGRAILEKVTCKILALDQALEPTLPAILALLDVPVEDPHWQALDPSQRRQHTLDALRRLLLRESQIQPLLLVLEDLHWMDSETQAMLGSLVESLPAARVLLLVNYRPEYQHAWSSKSHYRQLRLAPLPPESAQVALEALLGSDPGLADLKRLLIERTEGNPFFLEESVRTLRETKVLAGDRGAYRSTRLVEGVQVPATVQAVLAARIDRLAPEEKRLLQAAAVIGEEVPFALLQAIVDESEETLRQGLTHLQAAEFLFEISLFPELQYRFKHALTHDVAYGGMLAAHRRALHRRIVAAIEQRYGTGAVEHVERLGDHAFRGEDWERAVTYLRKAARKAISRPAYGEAASYFTRALAALAHLPVEQSTLENSVDLRFELRHALTVLGDYRHVAEHLNEAEAAAERLGDRHRLGRVCAYIAQCSFSMGAPQRAVQYGQRARALAREIGDIALEAASAAVLGQAHHLIGKYRTAAELLWEARGLLRADVRRGDFPVFHTVFCLSWSAWALAEIGEFERALAHAGEAKEIAQLADRPYYLATACLGTGVTHMLRGDFRLAIDALERGLQLCHRLDFLVHEDAFKSVLGRALALDGRPGDAVPLLLDSMHRAAAMGVMGQLALRAVWLSEAHLLAGRGADAESMARRALELARQHGERGQEAWALRVLAVVLSGKDPPATRLAEEHYLQAISLAGALEMCPLIAHCHLGLGTLYRRTGKEQETEEHLSTATTMYREMDMRFWLERAEAELRELP